LDCPPLCPAAAPEASAGAFSRLKRPRLEMDSADPASSRVGSVGKADESISIQQAKAKFCLIQKNRDLHVIPRNFASLCFFTTFINTSHEKLAVSDYLC
jgi:hypothetical protein